MRYKSVILWGLCAVIIVTGILYTLHLLPGNTHTPILDLSALNPGKIAIIIMASVLLVLHSAWTIGIPDGIILITLGFVLGLIFEILGVKYGITFGGRYLYSAAAEPGIMGVPWPIPFVWSGFIYFGYSIISSTGAWINNGKQTRIKSRLLRDTLISILSALIVLSIDIIMEPLQVTAGSWEWLDSGYYFGIPWGNFAGWFFVAFLTVLLSRNMQRITHRNSTKIAPDVLLIPGTGYLLLCLVLTFWAYRLEYNALVLVSLFTMFPIAIINLSSYFCWRTSGKKDLFDPKY